MVSAVQAVIFKRPRWRINTAKRKFKQMGFKLLKGKKIDIKRKNNIITSYRFRVIDPRKFKGFITKTQNDSSILFVIGFV